MEKTVSVAEELSAWQRQQWLRKAKLLQRVAALALSAVPVLLLLFYIAPSATSLGINGASIYGLFPDQTGLGSCAIGLVVLACFAALFAVPLLVGTFNKYAHPITPPFLIFTTLIQTAILITAATLTGRIMAQDGGLGLLKVGAAPALAIVFSGLSVLLGGAYMAVFFHPNTDMNEIAPYVPLPVHPPRPPRPQRAYPRWLGHASIAVFATIALGMFLFPIAPIMEMAGIAGESFYDLLAAGVPPVPVYTDCAIAILAFAGVGLVTAYTYLMLFFGKNNNALPVSSAVCATCALAQMIVASVVIAQIGADGGGMGLVNAGAAPVIILVFSIVALLFGAVATALPYVLKKPAEGSEKKGDMQREIEELKRRVEELQNR